MGASLSVLGTGWTDMGHTAFWVALLKIIWINILLSSNNAVVCEMACRGLPHRQRVWGMILGAGVAVVLRILFTAVVASLMLLPWLKIGGRTCAVLHRGQAAGAEEKRRSRARSRRWMLRSSWPLPTWSSASTT